MHTSISGQQKSNTRYSKRCAYADSHDDAMWRSSLLESERLVYVEKGRGKSDESLVITPKLFGSPFRVHKRVRATPTTFPCLASICTSHHILHTRTRDFIWRIVRDKAEFGPREKDGLRKRRGGIV